MSGSVASESELGLSLSQKAWRAVLEGFSSMNRIALMSGALLLLSLLFTFYNLRKRSQQVPRPKIDWQPKSKGAITNRTQGITDETIKNWKELRMCDVSNVRVSNILVHPIKSCRGTSVQEAKFSPEGLEVSTCFRPR